MWLFVVKIKKEFDLKWHLIILNVGLLITSLIPNPFAKPWEKVFFPAPSCPFRVITSPLKEKLAINFPNSCVSFLFLQILSNVSCYAFLDTPII